MFILPYKVDVPMARWPIANFVIIGFTVFAFIAAWTGALPPARVDELVLREGNPQGLLGCVLVHAGVWHIVGNMLFLWLFGNAVCAKVGNVKFVVIYVLLALGASLTHLMLDGAPAVGASGAINGVVGMFLVFYPRNQVSCVWGWWMWGYTGREGGEFEVDSRVMIVLWFVLDIVGVVLGDAGVAYWAHLGGFAFGFVIATALLYFRIVVMDETEESIYRFVPDWMPASLRRLDGGEHEPAMGHDTPADADAQLPPISDLPAMRRQPRPWAASLLKLRCGCGNVMQVARRHAGKKGRCPACKAEFTIPDPPKKRPRVYSAPSVEL